MPLKMPESDGNISLTEIPDKCINMKVGDSLTFSVKVKEIGKHTISLLEKKINRKRITGKVSICLYYTDTVPTIGVLCE